MLIDTPPGAPEVAYEAAMVADLMLLPCGPSPLDLFALKEALSLALKARAERRSKKPRIRFVPSKVLMSTNLGRGLASSLKDMEKSAASHRAAHRGGRGSGQRADGGGIRAGFARARGVPRTGQGGGQGSEEVALMRRAQWRIAKRLDLPQHSFDCRARYRFALFAGGQRSVAVDPACRVRARLMRIARQSAVRRMVVFHRLAHIHRRRIDVQHQRCLDFIRMRPALLLLHPPLRLRAHLRMSVYLSRIPSPASISAAGCSARNVETPVFRA